jgi:hypothetical protein
MGLQAGRSCPATTVATRVRGVNAPPTPRHEAGRRRTVPLAIKVRGKHRSPGRAFPTLDMGNFWPPPGRAGLAIVPAPTIRRRVTSCTMTCRATLAVHRSSAPLHVTIQAAGAPSAGSKPLNRPSRDPADGVTLGSLRTGGDSEGRRSGTPCHAVRPHLPARPTLSRTRDTDRYESDGRQGCQPHNVAPEGRRPETPSPMSP